MYRTPDNSDIPEHDGVEAEVADLVKTEEREAAMKRHPAGKHGMSQEEWDREVDEAITRAEIRSEREAEYALGFGEWYDEPYWE